MIAKISSVFIAQAEVEKKNCLLELVGSQYCFTKYLVSLNISKTKRSLIRVIYVHFKRPQPRDVTLANAEQVEGPEILSPNILKLVINKSPKGHKKAKYKKTLIEYTWPGALAIFLGRYGG